MTGISSERIASIEAKRHELAAAVVGDTDRDVFAGSEIAGNTFRLMASADVQSFGCDRERSALAHGIARIDREV